MVFGCWHRSKDFLFREELSRMCDLKSLSSHGGGATQIENIDDKVSGSEDEMSPDPALSLMLHFLGINRRKLMCSISCRASRQSLGAFGSIKR